MELVIALSIIFSVIALFTAIYACEELMKLRNRMERILDKSQRVIDNSNRIIEYMDVLECHTKKEY